MKKILFSFLCLTSVVVSAQRTFIHPGTVYNQADLDRMKAMVAAQREPYYSAWKLYSNSSLTTYRDYLPTMRGTSWHPTYIFDNTNYWMGTFGDIALHNALCWKITGTESYAQKAVAILNCYLNLHGTVNYGTNCLSNSGFTSLIDAAELIRNYTGWRAADQQQFKAMLVYPGYSTRERMNETRDSVTIYWNIYQGDENRHGNQGLWGLRTMISLGVFCDNDTIYDRAYNRFLSLPHRKGDLPYPKGPKTPGSKIDHLMSNYYLKYNTGEITQGSVDDFGYDDELKYWIWENGQTQEASRDQGHIMDGLGNVVDIARLFWNQGDDVYHAYDCRMLKGIDYAAKYNYGWYNKYTAGNLYWPEEALFEPTVENGQYIQRMTRNARWYSLKINPWSENNDTVWTRGKRFSNIDMMFMQYKVRQGLSDDSLFWLKRAYDIKMDVDGITEAVLTNYRTVWMAGDGGHFENSRFVPGLPAIPCTIKAVDYDFYSQTASGDGHTYHNSGTRTDTNYRKEGGLEITEDNGGFVLSDLRDGEWMNYTFTNAVSGIYQVSVTAKVSGEGTILGAAVDNGTAVSQQLAITGDYKMIDLGKLRIPAGACVLRLFVYGKNNQIQLSDIKLTAAIADTIQSGYVWNSRDYSTVSGSGSFLTDQSDKQLTSLTYSGTTSATFALSMSSVAYKVKSGQVYLLMHGKKLDHALLRKATYRLTGGIADITGNSTGGQASTWTYTGLGKDKDETILVWKADSSSSSRIIPLLKACYTGGYDNYTLKGLSFLAYGVSQHKNTVIDDINFYTFDEILAAYPELSGTSMGI
ncbi:MAG: alginate lyase family protein, partial [Bacteroidota bacterium]|nr:alginate lyase family protein [Bacteroidota bacterium]